MLNLIKTTLQPIRSNEQDKRKAASHFFLLFFIQRELEIAGNRTGKWKVGEKGQQRLHLICIGSLRRKGGTSDQLKSRIESDLPSIDSDFVNYTLTLVYSSILLAPCPSSYFFLLYIAVQASINNQLTIAAVRLFRYTLVYNCLFSCCILFKFVGTLLMLKF